MNWDSILNRKHPTDEHGNHGTAVIDPKAVKPTRTLQERLLAAVGRASDKHRLEGQASADKLTPEQRKDIAQQYRETADRLERGS